MLGIMAGMDQEACPGFDVVPRAVLLLVSQAPDARHLGRLGPQDSVEVHRCSSWTRFSPCPLLCYECLGPDSALHSLASPQLQFFTVVDFLLRYRGLFQGWYCWWGLFEVSFSCRFRVCPTFTVMLLLVCALFSAVGPVAVFAFFGGTRFRAVRIVQHGGLRALSPPWRDTLTKLPTLLTMFVFGFFVLVFLCSSLCGVIPGAWSPGVTTSQSISVCSRITNSAPCASPHISRSPSHSSVVFVGSCPSSSLSSCSSITMCTTSRWTPRWRGKRLHDPCPFIGNLIFGGYHVVCALSLWRFG